MNSERLLARVILRNALLRRNYHGRRHPVATMNDLPVPQGDFFIRHAANERKYNAVLASGVAIFAASVYIWSQNEHMSLNYAPPATYE